jgi:TolB-like protein
MKKILLIATTILFLQGCSVMRNTDNEPKNMPDKTPEIVPEVQQETKKSRKNSDEYLYYYVAHSFSQADVEKDEMDVNREKSGVQTGSNGYGHQYSFNGEKSLILSEVVSKMADQLLYNFPKKYHNETIALTSIVDLNDHSITNWLGQTVSEQFIHELHIRQLRVVDFKLTGNIKLTKAGEFALTRDWKKLNPGIDVRRILTGTMSRNEEGIIFNIRIVNADSNLVESTSSAFVPHNMFVGGQYDYRNKKYYERNSRTIQPNKSQVRLVR